MKEHYNHNAAVGASFHYAKDAAVAARGIIGDEEYNGTMRKHRARDKALHSWPSLEGASRGPSTEPATTPAQGLATPLRPCRSASFGRKLEFDGTPEGRMVDELAQVKTTEAELLQNVTKLTATMLLRIRVLEKAERESVDYMAASRGWVMGEIQAATTLVMNGLDSVMRNQPSGLKGLFAAMDADIKKLRADVDTYVAEERFEELQTVVDGLRAASLAPLFEPLELLAGMCAEDSAGRQGPFIVEPSSVLLVRPGPRRYRFRRQRPPRPDPNMEPVPAVVSASPSASPAALHRRMSMDYERFDGLEDSDDEEGCPFDPVWFDEMMMNMGDDPFAEFDHTH